MFVPLYLNGGMSAAPIDLRGARRQNRRPMPRVSRLALVVLLAFPAVAYSHPFTPSRHEPLGDYTIATWGERDGVPPGRIRAIRQDSDGYLWLATDAGLIRFDGARFDEWRGSGSSRLPSGAATSLLIARDRSLWVGRHRPVGDRPSPQRRLHVVRSGRRAHRTIRAVVDRGSGRDDLGRHVSGTLSVPQRPLAGGRARRRPGRRAGARHIRGSRRTAVGGHAIGRVQEGFRQRPLRSDRRDRDLQQPLAEFQRRRRGQGLDDRFQRRLPPPGASSAGRREVSAPRVRRTAPARSAGRLVDRDAGTGPVARPRRRDAGRLPGGHDCRRPAERFGAGPLRGPRGQPLDEHARRSPAAITAARQADQEHADWHDRRRDAGRQHMGGHGWRSHAVLGGRPARLRSGGRAAWIGGDGPAGRRRRRPVGLDRAWGLAFRPGTVLAGPDSARRREPPRDGHGRRRRHVVAA